MEYRQLGASGFMVPALTLGTGTFGGGNEFFKAWGASDVAEARRMIDICLEAGVNMFDSADGYSNGLAEEILGLSKMNWNTFDLYTKLPATVQSSNEIARTRNRCRKSCEQQGCFPATRRRGNGWPPRGRAT